MKKKSPEEMRRAKIVKTQRTLIRLKHSLRADEEINDVMPDTLAEFDAALSHRNLPKLQATLDDVLGSDDAAGA